jgi:hypothetical protein
MRPMFACLGHKPAPPLPLPAPSFPVHSLPAPTCTETPACVHASGLFPRASPVLPRRHSSLDASLRRSRVHLPSQATPALRGLPETSNPDRAQNNQPPGAVPAAASISPSAPIKLLQVPFSCDPCPVRPLPGPKPAGWLGRNHRRPTCSHKAAGGSDPALKPAKAGPHHYQWPWICLRVRVASRHMHAWMAPGVAPDPVRPRPRRNPSERGVA